MCDECDLYITPADRNKDKIERVMHEVRAQNVKT